MNYFEGWRWLNKIESQIKSLETKPCVNDQEVELSIINGASYPPTL